MLTNLDFLKTGEIFPPISESKRIKKYETNNKFFLTKHNEIFDGYFATLVRQMHKHNIEPKTIFNYHQLLTKKTADFICGEPPSVQAGDKSDILNNALNESSFDNLLYETVMDISKCGNGVFKIIGNKLSVVDLKYWFPVMELSNLKEVKYHVIAYPCNWERENPTELYIEIHSPGTVEIRHVKYQNKIGIGQNISEPKILNTGLEDFAVIPLSNVTCSSSYFGIDDYEIINSIIMNIMWRFACADDVLNKHSDPSMSGPASALEQDERTGIWFINLGNYFKRDSADDPEMKYIAT